MSGGRGRDSHVAHGRAAEERAAQLLQQQGYTILDRNARGGRGELDLVVQKGDLLVFVEVKAHASVERSLQAMTPGKQRRLLSAAEVWRMRHQSLLELQCRFDLITISPISNSITHYEDAFRS
ncbi:MAG: YraN family protein [Mariprofundales bacterium]|nr:YraN family protein [Mariprofundales bacterium]